MALGDAILVLLTERPMTGYELAKTFDTSIGFFWRADHQQIYRELTRLRDRGHIQGREVVQSGKPNKLVYTLTSDGRAALREWAARPSRASSIKDDLLVRLYALDSVDIDPLRADLMARLEYHRDRFSRFERILKKRFPEGTASPVDLGKLLTLRLGLRYEHTVVEWCKEALDTLPASANAKSTDNPSCADRPRRPRVRIQSNAFSAILLEVYGNGLAKRGARNGGNHRGWRGRGSRRSGPTLHGQTV